MHYFFLPFLLLLPACAFAQASIEWTQPTRGNAVAVDAAHNVFTVDYDYNPAGDITLTKRNPDGSLAWNATFNQTDNTKWEKATWVATDSEGNAIVTGTLMSGYSNPVNAASILMKFSPTGSLLWRRVYESSFDGSYTARCLIDELNDIYVLGMGSGPSGFVTKVKKFNAAGDSLWSYYDAVGIGAPVLFKFTPDNAIVISGRGIVGSVNGYAKIDRDGNAIWSLGGQNSLTVGDVAGDAFGNSYIVQAGTTLKKLNPAGAQIWSRTLTFAGNRVEVGTDNQPIVSGFPSTGSFGAAFWKTDTSGTTVWTNLDADGPLALMLHAQLRLDSQNNAYLAAGTLFEMAICKVNANGTSGWTITTAGSYANAFALDEVNDVYVVGGQTAKIRQSLPAPILTYVFQENCGSYLSWTAVAGAGAYQIYAVTGVNGEWAQVGTSTGTSWPVGCEDADLEQFYVVAVH